MGIYGYKYGYALQNPKKVLRLWRRDIQNRWGRARRGWGIVDTYSVDNYLARVIPEMIECLRDRNIGYPVDLDYKTWYDTLTKLADGFRSVQDPTEASVETIEKFQTETMPLFAKHFFSLWD